MSKQQSATIILTNGDEIHRVVKNVTGSSQYQQGDVIRYGQKIPVYRDLGMNPFWFQDQEIEQRSHTRPSKNYRLTENA